MIIRQVMVINLKIMVPQITTEEIQLMLERLKQIHNHKQITETVRVIQELVEIQQEQTNRKVEIMEIQIVQLKGEVQRLSRL